MSHRPIPCRVQTRGGSLAVVLTKGVRSQLTWRAGDYVAVRVMGDKIVMERLPLEGMAKIRTGEPEVQGAPYAAP